MVTVLFADIVGFTTFSESADPEQVKHLVDACFARLAEDVTAFGGKVDKVVGDAIIALFGAPVAHEDDPERAVRAALRMQETVGRPIDGLAASLQVRIGVNTGEVLVGALRAGGDYTAMGDVVNTAQRLQSVAEPGTVVVGSATHAATAEAIDYRSLGSLQAKGREQPVQAWAALEALGPPGQRRRRASPLIGRDAELALCAESIALAVRQRRATALVLIGEAGMGKSRLASEIGCVAGELHGAAVHEGRCVPYGEANVWWPVADVVRSACELTADAPQAEATDAALELVGGLISTAESDGAAGGDECERVVQGLLHIMGYDVALRGIEPQHAQEEARWAVLALFEALAERAPLVVALSDVHWADPAVLDLAADLLARLGRHRFVLVATARHEPPVRLLSVRRANTVVLTLDPLDRAAAGDLLDAVSHTELSPVLRDTLLDRSGGNPLYLEELAALLAGAEEPAATSGADTDLDLTRVPDTLRGLVSARVDAMGTTERSVLEDAAVWGRSGSVVALEHMGRAIHSLSESDVHVALGVLDEHDVLTVAGDRWSFHSDLVREVAYATLTKTDRAFRHTGIAWFLTQEQPSMAEASDRAVDVIAYHYGTAAYLAGQLGTVARLPDDLVVRAIEWIHEAADRAGRAELPAVAGPLFDQAIELAHGADHVSGAQMVRLLLGRGAAHASRAHLSSARLDIQAALDLAHEEEDRGLVADAMVHMGQVQHAEGSVGDAIETLRGAVDGFKDADDAQGESEALRVLGLTLIYSADNDEAESTVHEALERYRTLGDGRGEAWALQHLAWISYVAGRSVEANDRLEDSAAMFRELGDRGGLNWSLGLQAFVKYHQGDLATASAIGGEVLRETAERGDRWGNAMMELLAGGVRLWSGHGVEAARIARSAKNTFDEIDDSFGANQAAIALGRALVGSGAVRDGIEVLDDALADDALTGAEELRVALLVGKANALVQIGDAEAALATLDEMERTCNRPAGLADVERVVARALAEVQSGKTHSAMDRLVALAEHQPDATDAPYRLSALAMATAAAGGSVEEVAALADRLGDLPLGTYLDRFTAELALVLVRCAARGADAVAEFDRLAASIEQTDDEVARAVLAIARAETAANLGLPGADHAAAEATERALVLGIDLTGWRRAARLVLGAPPDVTPGALSGSVAG